MKIPVALYLIILLSFFNCREIVAQEDSRLLFSKDDIPEIQAKQTGEPFSHMFDVLKKKATGPIHSEYEHVYYAINNSFLYTLTGEKKYSDSVLNSVLYLINLDEWADDNFRSLGRAMYAKGVALAYDMCKIAWPFEIDTLISAKLIDMGASLKRNGGKGWPDGPGNNWRAVRFSGMGLCYLAADYLNDSLRESEVNYAFNQVVTYFNANLSEEENSMGWNPEGIGYIIYPAEFWGLFNIAIGNMYPEKNFLNENPAVKHTLSTIYRGAILMERDKDNKGYHPDFSDDNMALGGSGVHGLAFKNADEKYFPAFKWFYNRLFGLQGDKSFDSERGGVVFSYLYYPGEIEEQIPESIFGLNYADPVYGMFIFRDEYNDSSDIIAQHSAKGRSPRHCHGGADANGFRIWGLGGCWTTGAGRIGGKGSPGQTTVLRYDPEEQVPKDNSNGKVIDYEFFADGSGYSVIEGSSTLLPYHRRLFINDYSGLSGSPGVFVISDSTVEGKYWRLNTLKVNSIEFSDSSFLLESPNGSKMFGKIFKGDPETLRQGEFKRGSGYTWNGQSYENNKWLDFQSEDGEYLVVLALLEKDSPVPDIKYQLRGGKEIIFAGERVIEIENGEAGFFDKQEWSVLMRDEKYSSVSSHLKIFPNPGNENVSFNFFSEDESVLSAAIYDERGVLVYKLYEGRVNPGNTSFEWMTGGRKGFYFLRYTLGHIKSDQAGFIVM